MEEWKELCGAGGVVLVICHHAYVLHFAHVQ